MTQSEHPTSPSLSTNQELEVVPTSRGATSPPTELHQVSPIAEHRKECCPSHILRAARGHWTEVLESRIYKKPFLPVAPSQSLLCVGKKIHHCREFRKGQMYPRKDMSVSRQCSLGMELSGARLCGST